MASCWHRVGGGSWRRTAVDPRHAQLVFEASRTDPLTFLVTGGLLDAVVPLAGYIPARATRIDPTIALRYE